MADGPNVVGTRWSRFGVSREVFALSKKYFARKYEARGRLLELVLAAPWASPIWASTYEDSFWEILKFRLVNTSISRPDGKALRETRPFFANC